MNADIIRELKKNYKNLEQSIISQLKLGTKNHHLTTGHYREAIWKSLFRQIIPQKFSIQQGVFLIDSNGNVSNEVDLAVFDEQYTPYIFKYGKIHYIPIEAVAVVIQCKSSNIEKVKLEAWSGRIDKLETKEGAIVRLAEIISVKCVRTQPATKPIKILCSIAPSDKIECFDINLYVKRSSLVVDFNRKLDTLKNALIKFNCLKDDLEILKENKLKEKIKTYRVKNNSILSLVFQLNQLLMLINNPMFFPHKAYVDLFNRF